MKREMLPTHEFRSRLGAMFRALELSSRQNDKHDAMYGTICAGYDLGGIKTCEILERAAVEQYGFDRDKMEWAKEFKKQWAKMMAKIGHPREVVKVSTGIVVHEARERKAEIEREITARERAAEAAVAEMDESDACPTFPDLPF